MTGAAKMAVIASEARQSRRDGGQTLRVAYWIASSLTASRRLLAMTGAAKMVVIARAQPEAIQKRDGVEFRRKRMKPAAKFQKQATPATQT
jgi:ribosomal protein L30E